MKVDWEEDRKAYVVRRVQNKRPVVRVYTHSGEPEEELQESLQSWGKMFGDWETEKYVKAISGTPIVAKLAKKILIVGR